MDFDQISGLCGDRCVYTTMIREPMALAMSLWRYSKYYTHTRPLDASISEYVLGLHEGRRYTGFAQFGKLSSKRFLDKLDLHDTNDRALAFQTVSDTFLIIGVMEQWEETILLFSYHFPWILPSKREVSAAVSKPSKSFENEALDTLTPEAQDALDTIIRKRYDYEFYDLMVARLEHHLAAVCADDLLF